MNILYKFFLFSLIIKPLFSAQTNPKNRFFSFMQQHMPEGKGNLTRIILDYLDSNQDNKEWILVHELILDNPLKLEKVLVLDNGTLVYAFFGGFIEIHDIKTVYHLKLPIISKIVVLEAIGNNIVKIFSNNKAYFLTNNNTWNLFYAHTFSREYNLSPFNPETIKIENEILNTNVDFCKEPFFPKPTTGFIQNGNKVKIYVLKSQKEILTQMF